MANDELCVVAAADNALVITLNRPGRAPDEITLSIGEANMLVMTLPGLLSIARRQDARSETKPRACPIQDYHLDCMPSQHRILLTLFPAGGDGQAFAINVEMIPALLRDLHGAQLLLETSPSGLPN